MSGRGLFIVLEGIDGSGKSEQSQRLASWLRELGHDVVLTREPTDGAWGRRYRAWARGDSEADPDQVLGFFVEDRREHVAALIRPALDRGAIVICDRYVASTLAYQAAQGLERGALRERMDVEGFPEPDLVMWLRVPVDAALVRLGRHATERFERRAFLERVDGEYEALGLEPIAAEGSEDEVERALRGRIGPLLRAP